MVTGQKKDKVLFEKEVNLIVRAFLFFCHAFPLFTSDLCNLLYSHKFNKLEETNV